MLTLSAQIAQSPTVLAATRAQPPSDRGRAKSHAAADAKRRKYSTLRELEYGH